MRAIGYTRVSTGAQAESGAGLEVQRAAIRAECERRGWTLADIYEDAGVSGGKLARPALDAAREVLAAGGADVLIVLKVDRLSRSLADFAATLAEAHRQGWQLVALDLGVDTTSPNGKFMAQIMGAVAELEREMISQRTKAALAVKRAEGVRLGRPSKVSPATLGRIRALRAEGKGPTAIATVLNSEKTPTPGGAPAWGKSTVRYVLSTV